MPRILLTGFGPFDRWAVNSSWEAVRRVARRRPGIEAAWLPVEHAGAAERVDALVRALAPEAVLLCGLTPGPVPRLERVARAGPLAAGNGQGGGKARGPSLRPGRWPWAAAHDRAAARALPLGRSTDAGGYVCDSTYWAALGTGVRLVAFLHLPPVGPAWPPARAAALVETVLEVAGAPALGPCTSEQPATA